MLLTDLTDSAPTASMRPARKGPETLFRAGLWIPGAWGFNEAGPQGAGNVESNA